MVETPSDGTTVSKHIKLSPSGRQQIDAWARANGLTFSAAIETLALLGLHDERSAYVVPVLRQHTLQALEPLLGRFGEVLSDLLLRTHQSHIVLEVLLLQLIRDMELRYPDDFAQRMQVPRESRRQGDVRVRELYDRIRRQSADEAWRAVTATLRAVRALQTEVAAATEQADHADHAAPSGDEP